MPTCLPRSGRTSVGTFTDYQAYLCDHPAEWPILDSLCRIAISRFYRDRALFQCLEAKVLPCLTQRALTRGQPKLTCWSLGSASGEEPSVFMTVRAETAETSGETGMRRCPLPSTSHAGSSQGRSNGCGAPLMDNGANEQIDP